MNKILSIVIVLSLVYLSYARELIYKGNPFLVNASYKASNIIVLPEPVKSAYSSIKGVKVDFAEGSNRLIVAIPNRPSDLIIEGESGTLYVFNLNPKALPSQIFTVKNKKIAKKKAFIFEAKNDVEDVIARIIRAVILGTAPDGYDKKAFSKTIVAKDVIIIGKAIYDGGRFKVYVADIVNRTNNKVLRVREDSAFAVELAKKLSGLEESDIRAIAISREVIKPKSSGKDWYSTYYLITDNKSHTSPLLKSFYEGEQ